MSLSGYLPATKYSNVVQSRCHTLQQKRRTYGALIRAVGNERLALKTLKFYQLSLYIPQTLT